MATTPNYLHVWARKVLPSSPFNVDHTWLTSYPNPGPPSGFVQPIPGGHNYWFCWGVFHSGGDKGQIPKPYKNWCPSVEASMELAARV